MKKILCIWTMAVALGFAACSKDDNNNRIGSSTADSTVREVKIGGVTWASHNVDCFQTFAERPDMYTKFYQWNRGTPWPATGEKVNKWNQAADQGSIWTIDPCPLGWRLPDSAEFRALYNAGSTWANANTRGNAVAGMFFGANHATATIGNLDSSSCIFLPASGYRHRVGGPLEVQGAHGSYWSGTQAKASATNGVRLYFTSKNGSVDSNNKAYGYSIRCVTANSAFVAVTGVTLSQTSATLAVGETRELTATVQPSNATNKAVSWSSNDTAVAAVANGTITAVGEGTATITVTTQDGNKTASCTVTISAVSSGLGIVSFATTQTWTAGSQTWSDAVQATGCNKTSFNGDTPDCRSNPGQKGNLYSWYAVDNYKSQLCPDGWRVPTTQDFVNLDIALGGTGEDNQYSTTLLNAYLDIWGGVYGGGCHSDGTLEAQGLDAYYWSQSESSSGDAYCLAFSSDGDVIQPYIDKNIGFAVRCVQGGSTSVPVTGVTLNQTSTTLAVGETRELTATVQPSNATNKNVTWSSSNTDVATVSSSGLVTAVAEGTATITVTTQDGNKTASCAVTVTNPIATFTNVKMFCTMADGSTNSAAASVDGTTFALTGASTTNQQKCDFVYFYGKMYSPYSIASTNAILANITNGWTTKNDTRFTVLLGVDFNSITAENIATIAGNPTAADATVALNSVVAFKTAAGKSGIFKVVAYQAGYGVYDYCTIDIKVQQ